MADLRAIAIANSVPRTVKGGKRELIDDILRFQGNYHEEYAKVNLNQEKKKMEYQELKAMKRTEIALKALTVNQLYTLACFHLEAEIRDKIGAMKGKEKRNKYIEELTDNTIEFNKNKIPAKYSGHYVYSGHWFRSGDINADRLSFDVFQPRVFYKCKLCLNDTMVYKKQFNVCPKCHDILQHVFVRKYLTIYQLSAIIIEHYDIRSYMWQRLKNLL